MDRVRSVRFEWYCWRYPPCPPGSRSRISSSEFCTTRTPGYASSRCHSLVGRNQWFHRPSSPQPNESYTRYSFDTLSQHFGKGCNDELYPPQWVHLWTGVLSTRLHSVSNVSDRRAMDVRLYVMSVLSTKRLSSINSSSRALVVDAEVAEC